MPTNAPQGLSQPWASVLPRPAVTGGAFTSAVALRQLDTGADHVVSTGPAGTIGSGE